MANLKKGVNFQYRYVKPPKPPKLPRYKGDLGVPNNWVSTPKSATNPPNYRFIGKTALVSLLCFILVFCSMYRVSNNVDGSLPSIRLVIDSMYSAIPTNNNGLDIVQQSLSNFNYLNRKLNTIDSYFEVDDSIVSSYESDTGMISTDDSSEVTESNFFKSIRNKFNDLVSSVRAFFVRVGYYAGMVFSCFGVIVGAVVNGVCACFGLLVGVLTWSLTTV